ncbi:MAG: DUF2806 domain-containing protein [Enterobacterales bacterium]
MIDEISEDASTSIMDTAVDTATDLISGASIPAPIKKSFFKAVGQLCTAAVDVPVSYLEGKAAETRAETSARLKIIVTGGTQIAEKMNVNPEYAKVAVEKYGQKIIKEQVNLDQIVHVAVDEINKSKTEYTNQQSTQSEEQKEISDDWLNAFEKEACQKSSDEMKLLFGKILAGEIQKPSTYSIRTLRLLSQLDNQAAELFHRLCSLCISQQIQGNIIDARVVSLSGNPSQNSLIKYGLGYGSLKILEEYGLISSEYNSYMDYRMAISQSRNVPLPFTYNGDNFGFVRESEATPIQEFKVNGVALSSSGKELLSIVDITPDNSYFEELKVFFKQKKMHLVKISTLQKH